jgi:hypothetical protein
MSIDRSVNVPYRSDNALAVGGPEVVVDVGGDDDAAGRVPAVADESTDGSCDPHATSATVAPTARPTTRERRMLF